MEQHTVFTDMLEERRKDCDILWVSRSMDPLLPHKLPADSKYTRSKIISAVLSDPRVKLAIHSIAASKDISVKDVEDNAYSMVNEMASKAHLATVRWLGILITKTIKRMFLKVYINEAQLANLKEQMQISQIQYIYVPSHRSYMDFILLSYILFSYDMALPNIASGMDFYNMKIVGELLRKTGAFFMRRTFSDDSLYKEVFRSYISNIVSHSERAIEFFIEGTRSRSQKSIVPKYGLLSIILESFFKGDVPDIHFIPMSISYERPPEELLYVYEMLGIPKPKESTTGLFRALSILEKPFSHGCVFFNIGEPISARQFLHMSYRKMKVLEPFSKIPSVVVENLAYSIIESHKRNTVIMQFNIIALLLNERIQVSPREPYTLDTIAKDYQWFKNFMNKSLNVLVYPDTEVNHNDNSIKEQILESLKPHNELIVLDTSNTLRLKQRHKRIDLKSYTNIKGHSLSEETMQIAVPAINIIIYVNPIMAFLAKIIMVTATIEKDGTKTEKALERYEVLRKLVSTEFVIPMNVNKNIIKAEWEESLNILLSNNCLQVLNDCIFIGENTKLFSILHNIILPFIDVIYIICVLLYEWDEGTLGELTDRTILSEAQKKIEKLMLERKDRCQHPYCLSLDICSATLSTLLSQSIIVTYQKRGVYRADKDQLAYLIHVLSELPLKRPVGTYIDACPLIISPSSMNIQAKL